MWRIDRRQVPSFAQAALTILLATAVSAPALAQSGYTLSTLAPAASAVPLTREQDFFIDATHRVTGYTSYDTGTYQWPICIPFISWVCSPGGRVYFKWVTSWPASTASTVQPVKIVQPTGGGTVLVAASPNGRVVSTQGANLVYDTTTGALIGLASQTRLPGQGHEPSVSASMGRRSIDNTGLMIINSFGDDRTYLWSLSAQLGRTTDVTRETLTELPPPLEIGGYLGSKAHALASRDLVVGEVRHEVLADIGYPAIWANGQLQVLEHKPGRAFAVNQVGQVLVQRADKTWSVWFNGTPTALPPLKAGQILVANAINASGTVVGRSGDPEPNVQLPWIDALKNARAFIWRNGVTSDLTQFVASKGVKLPSGAVIEDVRDINDQGSMVVVLRNWLGTRSIVRLTAKP